MKGMQRRHGGFALVAAISILVLLSLLGAYLGRIAVSSQMGSAQDIQGSRAYQAARAGVEWGVYQILVVGGGCPTSPPPPVLSNDSAVAMNVVVECKPFGPYTDGAAPFSIYQIKATACNGASASCTPATPIPAGYVERQIVVSVSK